jgi:uncharacterized protein (DUF849 family)
MSLTCISPGLAPGFFIRPASPHAISLGGHVRVGFENAILDCSGVLA